MQSSVRTNDRLIGWLIEKFVPQLVPGSQVAYANDSGFDFDETLLSDLGVAPDCRQRLPDLVPHDPAHDWLLVVESATSHGPIVGQRLEELARIFHKVKCRLILIAAFPNRTSMTKYPGSIACETHAWCAGEPEHVSHFNGIRLLGPYSCRE